MLRSVLSMFVYLLIQVTMTEPASAQDEIFRMGALGDSITAGFNAGGLFDHKRNSWSGGFAIDSHAVKLRAKLGQHVRSRNVAKSGAFISDLPRQAGLLLRAGYRPDYVTILIGANDICTGQQKTEPLIKSSRLILDETLAKLRSSNSDVKIALAGVPNLPHLYNIMKEKPTCLKQWKSFNVCSTILLAKPEQIKEATHTWQSFNQMLEQFAADNPEHVKFAPKTSEPIFQTSEVSAIDCFHPNVRGQVFLSNSVWEQGWYAD